MYFRYGSYTHDANEVELVSAFKRATFGDAGTPKGYVLTWRLRGLLFASSQADLTMALAALDAAYSVHSQDAALLLDDGITETHHVMSSGDSVSGVKVLDGPSFPEGNNGQYNGYRTYEITLEAEYENEVGGEAEELLSWYESLRFTGNGGPGTVMKQGLIRPQKQIVSQSTPFKATQTGSAMGKNGWLNPPAPLWPDALINPEQAIEYKGPKRSGPPGQPELTEFVVDWDYQFESVSPLGGLPTPPPA